MSGDAVLRVCATVAAGRAAWAVADGNYDTAVVLLQNYVTGPDAMKRLQVLCDQTGHMIAILITKEYGTRPALDTANATHSSQVAAIQVILAYVYDDPGAAADVITVHQRTHKTQGMWDLAGYLITIYATILEYVNRETTKTVT